MKKTIVLLLSLFLVVSFSGCNKKPVLKEDIHIFYTSDVLAQYLARFETIDERYAKPEGRITVK